MPKECVVIIYCYNKLRCEMYFNFQCLAIFLQFKRIYCKCKF